MMTYRQNLAPQLEAALEPLSAFRPGEGGWVSEIQTPDAVAQRLRELGVIEGSFIKVLHEAPFGRDPLAIQVRGGKLALRRQEAQKIAMERVSVL